MSNFAVYMPLTNLCIQPFEPPVPSLSRKREDRKNDQQLTYDFAYRLQVSSLWSFLELTRKSVANDILQ